MDILTKLKLYAHVMRWRWNWEKYDLHYPPPVKDNPKFMTAWEAVKLIPDGAVMGTSGMAGNQPCSLMYWAIRDHFRQEGRPRDLTLVNIGGQGGRGKVPGTLEELAVEGLIKRMIVSHTESCKGQLEMGQAGKLEIQCTLFGPLTFCLRAQGEGQDHIICDTGAGTFVDPRTGTGTRVCPPDAPQYVEVTESGRFKYWLPPVDTAVFSAPAADRKGNIYFKNCSFIGESYSLPKAVRRHGGRTIVNVGLIVEEGYDKEFLPADQVDAIVYWPETEQVTTVKHRKYWDCFTPQSTLPIDEGLARTRYINSILRVMSTRVPVDEALARLGTRVFAENAMKGDHVDIGVGHPEEVARLLHESGVMKNLHMINESGAFGGVSAPGIFFGAAINPHTIVPSVQAFDRMYKRLDWVILGALEVDSQGNVNVSRRGKDPINHVGPGGFIDLCTCAKNILFCCSWSDQGKIAIQGNQVKVLKPGNAKFIDKVQEITFNGHEGLKQNKKVFYITHLGAFRLTDRGMELIYVMPGIDIQKDIIEACSMKIVLPESGAPTVVGDDVVTGRDFRFELGD
ncbi:MAG TPA: hypothetical protein ENN29_00190 [Candidatus Hydrogenedentes bacterium]|nr:hypothetical protein [Candidatus Hydrogenedentota bacterium]